MRKSRQRRRAAANSPRDVASGHEAVAMSFEIWVEQFYRTGLQRGAGCAAKRSLASS
jgi:hypothetical protein